MAKGEKIKQEVKQAVKEIKARHNGQQRPARIGK